MKPIRLPEPPGSPPRGVPDIFEGGVYGVVKRAVIIGNGFPASENQSVGLVRALGLAEKQTLYRVTRPRGGINEYLHWLPVSLHKQIYYIIRLIYGYSQVLLTSKGSRVQSLTGENGGSVGLSSVLEADVKSIVKMAKGTAEKDGPLLVVACGRDTISIASSIKKLASENVFVVQIQHPRTQLNRFDLVVAPQHDYYALTAHAQEQVPRLFRKYVTPNESPTKNVVLTVGALHQVDFAALRSAAITWHDEFAPLPKPLIVVNIGGPTSHCKYGRDLSKQLTNSLRGVLDSCGSVRISFSRRTPDKVANFVRKELGDDPKIYIYDGEGYESLECEEKERSIMVIYYKSFLFKDFNPDQVLYIVNVEPNPHMGHLAWADAFIVTADSVSMLSEACSTGKPVYVVGSERCKWKFGEFHKTLREKGLVRPFTGLEDMSESWSYPPLNDTADVANRVHEALADRGWRLRP